jgi:hypothetical protein
MLPPRSHRPPSPPPFLEPLTVRDPANSNAPGLKGNKNGPPGPEGNQKGPPPAATSTEELASSTSQGPPSGTRVSDSPTSHPAPSSPSPTPLPASSGSTKPHDITLSSAIVTFIAPTPSTTSTTSFPPVSTSSQPDPSSPETPLASLVPAVYGTVAWTLISATSSVKSLTTLGVSASSVGFPTSAQYSVLKSTPQRSFAYTSSATPVHTEMGYHTANGTAQSKHNVVLSGQKAGIAVGTIGMSQSPLDRDHLISQANNRAAGFAFILTLILLLFKWRRGERPKALLSPVRRLPGIWGNSHWLSRSRTPDAVSGTLLAAEAGSSGGPAWDYRATFAEPPVTEKARSLRKPLRLLRLNPLGLNPVTSHAIGAKTPSRKSFASSFFRRRSTASTLRSAFHPSSPQEQPRSVSDPPLLPSHAAHPSPRPSAISGQSTELAQSDNNSSPRPLAMPPQMPPQTLLLPWRHRNSQMTTASTESDAHSTKVVPGLAKPHYLLRLHSGGGVPQESEKELPLPPLPVSPSLWLKGKVLRRPHSTTSSKGEKEYHMESDNSDKSAGTERATFGRSGRKQVQMGQRISGASAGSLVAEKQEAWPL